MEEEIILREKEKSFHISRIPKNTKDEIIEFANEEFCEDYGMAIKFIWDNFKIWKIYFESIDTKLSNILDIVSKSKEEQNKKESITLLSGNKIEKGGKKFK